MATPNRFPARRGILVRVPSGRGFPGDLHEAGAGFQAHSRSLRWFDHGGDPPRAEDEADCPGAFDEGGGGGNGSQRGDAAEMGAGADDALLDFEPAAAGAFSGGGTGSPFGREDSGPGAYGAKVETVARDHGSCGKGLSEPSRASVQPVARIHPAAASDLRPVRHGA